MYLGMWIMKACHEVEVTIADDLPRFLFFFFFFLISNADDLPRKAIVIKMCKECERVAVER